MNPIALVTGASAGLGKDFAWLFAEHGVDVVLVARRREALQALADEITAKHATVKAHVLAEDLASPGADERIAAELARRELPIEYLVNNAGFGATGAFTELPLARQLEMIQVNVTVLVALTHRLLPAMLERKSGKILNLGSTAGFLPGPFMAMYYASKAFVNSFTEALATELRGTGVTATVSCPGPVATEFGAVAGNDKTPLFASGVMGAREVAEDAFAAMMRGRPLAVNGFRNKLRIAALRIAPRGVQRNAAAKLNQAKG